MKREYAARKLTDLYPDYECLSEQHLFFLGLLAYPTIKDAPHLRDFIKAIHSETAKAYISVDESLKEKIDPSYLAIEARKAKRNIEQVFNVRIPRRMDAVTIAMGKINSWEPSLNRSVDRMLILQNDHGGDSGNTYRLIWKETIPVLHLAFALHPFFHQWIPDNEKPEVLSIDLLKRIKKNGLPSRDFTLPLRDLFVLSNQIRMDCRIEERLDLLTTKTWLSDVITIAETWAVLLPALIPSIRKTDLYQF